MLKTNFNSFIQLLNFLRIIYCLHVQKYIYISMQIRKSFINNINNYRLKRNKSIKDI